MGVKLWSWLYQRMEVCLLFPRRGLVHSVMKEQYIHMLQLRKTYSEVIRNPTGSVEEELLINLASQFLTISSISDPGAIKSDFRELLHFSSTIANSFVYEIRRRASNQSTESAAAAVAAYLQDFSGGGTLLRVIHLLSKENEEICQVLCSASLPSTLVKSMYLFYDDVSSNQFDIHFVEKIHFQDLFRNILLNVLTYPCTIRELLCKDDLALLFSMASSWCPSYNSWWRNTACEAIIFISNHFMSLDVISHVHNKGCIGLFVENCRTQAADFYTCDMVDLLSVIFCFLKNSCSVSDELLRDFEGGNGYIFLSDYVLYSEPKDNVATTVDSTQFLMFLFPQLISSGNEELTMPTSSNLVYLLPNHDLPNPKYSSHTARNVCAFQALEVVFVESRQPGLCCSILDIIASIYLSEPANYWLLEKHAVLAKMAEHIHYKDRRTQSCFFNLLDLIVFRLNAVPYRELITFTVLLKRHADSPCAQECIAHLLKILKHHAIFQSIFLEVGIVEVLTNVFDSTVAVVLAQNHLNGVSTFPHEFTIDYATQAKVSRLLDILGYAIAGSSANANTFRESGGSNSVLSIVEIAQFRATALNILQNICLLPGGDYEIGSLLIMLLTVPVQIKLDVLLCMQHVLRDSHKCRLAFRKAGGFLYIMSSLTALENSLAETSSPDEVVLILTYVEASCNVLAAAMRFEPANSHFFEHTVGYTGFADTLRLLGCFDPDRYSFEDIGVSSDFYPQIDRLLQQCSNVFMAEAPLVTHFSQLQLPLPSVLCISRWLYDMSLNASDVGLPISSYDDSNNMNPNLLVVHSGALLALLGLVPSVFSSDSVSALATQLFMVESVRSCVRSERNQQLMCEAGLPDMLLKYYVNIFTAEKHPLFPALNYMLERLASQAIQPKHFRKFLRLGSPLCSRSLNEPLTSCATVSTPLAASRVQSLVSMMTPKDIRLSSRFQSPSVVELNMAFDGFGGIFLPSTKSDVSSNSSARLFPPDTGWSFVCWLNILKFSDPSCDIHPVRLLTMMRSIATTSGEDLSGIFTVQLSGIDRSLIVSTKESADPFVCLDNSEEHSYTRLYLPDLKRERTWIHFAIVLNRPVARQFSMSVFIDGKFQACQDLSCTVQSSGDATSKFSAFIGTPPGSSRCPSRLLYQLGSVYLIDDALAAAQIEKMCFLGPQYIGSFQMPSLSSVEVDDTQRSALFSEDRLSVGLAPTAVSTMTLAKLRKLCTKSDCKIIARYLGIGSFDNETPVRVLCNTAVHLNGPQRPLGGVVVGYLGVRSFRPQTVSHLLGSVGIPCVLGLVAMASTSEELYAAVKCLDVTVKYGAFVIAEIKRMRGYKIIAALLKEKSHLINAHVIHLVFCVTGTLDCSTETSLIGENAQAFEDILCDLEVWNKADGEVQRLLFEHIYELVSDSKETQQNLTLVRSGPLPARLMCKLFSGTTILEEPRDSAFSLLSALLQPPTEDHCLLQLGQLMSATLPSQGIVESGIPRSWKALSDEFRKSVQQSSLDPLVRFAYIRNRCFEILLRMIETEAASDRYQLHNQIVRVLGFDWLLAFLSPNVAPSTVTFSVRVLSALLIYEPAFQIFRDGSGGLGWLTGTEAIVQNRSGNLLGFSVPTTGASAGSSTNINTETESVSFPGFQVLSQLVLDHTDVPAVILTLISLLVGRPNHTSASQSVTSLSLDLIWASVFNASSTQLVSDTMATSNFCFEVVPVLLGMCKHRFEDRTSPHCKEEDFPGVLMQFFSFLYHNISGFTRYCLKNEEFVHSAVLCSLPQSCLSPTSNSEESKSATDGIRGTVHPAKRQLIDFLANLVVDSFSIQRSGKRSIIEVILASVSTNCICADGSAFVTALFESTLDHLLSHTIFDNRPHPSLHESTCDLSIILENIAEFTSNLVDCLWCSVFVGSNSKVLDFVLQALMQIRKNTGLRLDSLYRCLNRVVLYILFRKTTDDQWPAGVVDILERISANKSIIFNSQYSDREFFMCLSFLLFQLHARASSVDFVDFDSGITAEKICGIWETMYESKKALLEESFDISLVPLIESAKNRAYAAAERAWLKYLTSEAGAEAESTVNGNSSQPRGQMQSKFMVLTEELTSKLTKPIAKSIARSPDSSHKGASLSSCNSTTSCEKAAIDLPMVSMWMQIHISLIKELMHLHVNQCQQYHEHVFRWAMQEWAAQQKELTRDRGLWGPPTSSRLDKWRLDTVEGPFRMRKRTVANELFYIHYPYRPALDEAEFRSVKFKFALCIDSFEYYERTRIIRPILFDERIIDRGSYSAQSVPQNNGASLGFDDLQMKEITDLDVVDRENALLLSKKLDSHAENEINCDDNQTVGPTTNTALASTSCSVDEDGSDMVEQLAADTTAATSDGAGPDNRTLLWLLEAGEEIQSMFRCARINGVETSEGLLLFGREHYYVVDGFTLLKTREIRDLNFLPKEFHDPIVPYTTTTRNMPLEQRLCSKFAYEDIREVHRRRYLLQPIALEIFSADGRNYLLAFPRRTRNKVHQKFTLVAKELVDVGEHSVSGQNARTKIESASGLFSSLIGDPSVTQRWVRGEISNFQYLMHLNTIAGRSYNDLMQYPIFPWILSDYESESLDLSNPAVFRDFTKPMGAQNQARLDQFLKRYREWDDPSGETPPYMYGTHYSSAMIVVSYLVRTEPFTQHFLNLQGGHFDLADRMFHSVKDAWMSASQNNMADVRELIPEFFYLPEFLVNSNNFDFGWKQNGIPLGDVVLPTWSKGNHHEFIRLHRQALECDYVSEHLHEWIDLIFGYKQQGAASLEANNVYHALFYEGSVKLEDIDDPLVMQATLGFINNFGQIPAQLFKKPHPVKKPQYSQRFPLSLGVTTERIFSHCLDSLVAPTAPTRELKTAVGQIIQNDRGAVNVVEQNKTLIPTLYNRYIAWGFADRSLRLGMCDTGKSVCLFEANDFCDDILSVVCPTKRMVVTGGTSTVINFWEIVSTPRSCTLRHRKALYGHTDAISVIAGSRSFGIIVSGSRDLTCIVWDLSRVEYIRQLGKHPATITAIAINETTGDIATCASSHLTIWSINGDQLATINTSLVHSDSKQIILCATFSTLNEWDPLNVIVTGSNDGIVRFFTIEYVYCANGTQDTFEEIESRPETFHENGDLPGTRGFPTTGLDEREFDGIEEYSWRRRLVCRTTQSLHTAFERRDNPTPAEITAVSTSRDHKTLFVGDSRGRVWSWLVPDIGESTKSDNLVQESGRTTCSCCNLRFNFSEQRHHCRNCGQIVCGKCSSYESQIRQMKVATAVRVCQTCFVELKRRQS